MNMVSIPCGARTLWRELEAESSTDLLIECGLVWFARRADGWEAASERTMRAQDIPVERLIISSDCGMGREGMSRRHAFYKIVALVQGTNIVRRELGLPVADCLAADPRFSLVPPGS